MSLPEAIIAQIQDPSLSLSASFELFLDYIMETDGEKRFLPLDLDNNAVDPNEPSFAQVLNAFRKWFCPESNEFKKLMKKLTWNPAQIQVHSITASSVFTWMMEPLISMGKIYYDRVATLCPEAILYPMGDNLPGYRDCIAMSKLPGYFYLKLSVELEANIIHSRRDVRGGRCVSKFRRFLEFVDRECLADYMGVFGPAAPA
jgi:hypothetical protein